MRTLYLHMPELPRTRHIIAGDRHIINTAAPESKTFHRVARKETVRREEKSHAQRRGNHYLIGE